MAPLRRGSGDRGQAVPLVIAAVALAAVCLIGLGRFAAGAVDAARARTAADAAALAGVARGRGAAANAAASNGGRMVAFSVVGDDVVVRVTVGRATASARATLAMVALAAPP